MSEIPTLVNMLSLLAVGAGLGPLVSFLIEKAGWFQKLNDGARMWIVFGICIVTPVAARLLLSLVPAEVWVELEPYWQALAAGFMVFLASQGYHLIKKLREE